MDKYYMTNQSGKKSSDYFLLFEKYPVIRHGQEKVKTEQIPGKGNVHIPTGTYTDTEIKLVLDLNLAGQEDKWDAAYANVSAYLKELEAVSFCDDPDTFYKVRSVEIDAADRYSEVAGDFGVKIICQAGAYVYSGLKEMRLDEFNGVNAFYAVSRPIYKISGEGVCKLLVNGKGVTANVAQSMVIDTERSISYREDTGAVMNTSVTGNYEDLFLIPGENMISATPGFNISVIPNWRKL